MTPVAPPLAVVSGFGVASRLRRPLDRCAGPAAVATAARSGPRSHPRLPRATASDHGRPRRRFDTVRYSGVLAAASKWRPFIVPKPAPTGATDPAPTSDQQSRDRPPECVDGSRYRPWAELLKRTFGIDVETCPRCGGRMRLLAVITDLASAARFLPALRRTHASAGRHHRPRQRRPLPPSPGRAVRAPLPRSRSRATVLAEQDCTTTRPIRAVLAAGVVRGALN